MSTKIWIKFSNNARSGPQQKDLRLFRTNCLSPLKIFHPSASDLIHSIWGCDTERLWLCQLFFNIYPLISYKPYATANFVNRLPASRAEMRDLYPKYPQRIWLFGLEGCVRDDATPHPHADIKKPSHWLGLLCLKAERVGFEPTVNLHPRWFSRPEP